MMSSFCSKRSTKKTLVKLVGADQIEGEKSLGEMVECCLSGEDVLYPSFQLEFFLVLLEGIGTLLGADSEASNLALGNCLF